MRPGKAFETGLKERRENALRANSSMAIEALPQAGLYL